MESVRMVLIHSWSRLGWLTVSPLRVEGCRGVPQTWAKREASRFANVALYCKTFFFASFGTQLCRLPIGVTAGSQSCNDFHCTRRCGKLLTDKTARAERGLEQSRTALLKLFYWYSSQVATGMESSPAPPVIRTLPLGSSVEVCQTRG
jgi:hypothetical protein